MATLSGNKIKDTYQSLIKLTDNGNLTTGAKRVTDGFGNNSPLFLSTTQIGVGVTPTVQFHASGDGKFGGNLTVIGNLVVEGSTTTVGTDTLTVKDPLIVLANNNTSSDAVDIGFYGKYRPSSTTLFAGLFRDAGDDKFKLFKSLQVEPTTTVNTSGTGYAVATLVSNLEGNVTGNVTGNVSGSAATVTGAAQTAITSVGTLTALQVDNININGNTISSTAGTDLNITPLAGQQIVLDGAIVIDAGVVTGATSITSTAFVGALTGDVTGNADTATKIASITNSNIVQLTSSQTLTNKTIDLDNNTVSNIEVDNLKSGVLDTDLSSVSGSDDTLASAKAIKTYVDAQVDTADTLAEILAIGNTTGGTDIAVSSNDDITFADNSKSIYGAGSDFKIRHNSTTNANEIASANSRQLQITQDNLFIGNEAATETLISAVANGAVELYYDNSKKFETTSTGVTVTGVAVADGLDLGDNEKIRLGASQDLEIYHNGTNSVIDNNTNNLLIQTASQTIISSDATNNQLTLGHSSGNWFAKATNSNTLIIGSESNATNNITLDTTNGGSATFSGVITTPGGHTIKNDSNGHLDIRTNTAGKQIFIKANGQLRLDSGGAQAFTLDTSQNATFAGDVSLADSKKVIFGAGSDLQIYHNGSDSIIYNGTGALMARANDFRIQSSDASSTKLIVNSSGVGIGTTSPAAPLQVVATGIGSNGTIGIQGANAHLGFKNSSGTFRSFVGHFNAAGHGSDADLNLKTGYNSVGNIRFTADGDTTAAQMFLQGSTGNVGISTTSPSTLLSNSSVRNASASGLATSLLGLNIEVPAGGNSQGYVASFANTQTASGNVNAGVLIEVGSTDTTTRLLSVESGGTNRFEVRGDGNVGIGTTSPATKLQVANAGEVIVRSSMTAADGYRGGFEADNQHTGGTIWSMFSTNNSDGYFGGGKFVIGNESMGGVDANTTAQFVIDGSGNTGIGTPAPSKKLHVYNTAAADVALLESTQVFSTLAFKSSSNTDTVVFGIDGGGNAYIENKKSTHPILFTTNSNERMRINSSGTLCFGKTTEVFSTTGVNIFGNGDISAVRSSGVCLALNRRGSDGEIAQFYKSDTQVGNISVTSSATSFNTSSDYRLKEDLQDFAGLDMVSKIPVYDFKWKTDESRSYGVMAHELQEVLPQAVSGEKDAEEMQSVDYSKIVPLLVKSIQELQERIKQLEDK
jgi:hypothetical protein